MTGSTRREFLGTAGVLAAGSLAQARAAGFRTPENPGDRPRPKVAAITSAYHYLSHAYHIVGRFLDGFDAHDGRGLHRPDYEIASLFIEQTPANDLGKDRARKAGVRLSPTIADALTLGTGQLAVDAVL